MNQVKVKKNCLLIAPLSFYSYSEYLKKTLMADGYDVTVCNDEYPQNAVGKIMGKLKVPFLLNITRKIIKKKFLDGNSYDLVLIVKGRGMSVRLVEYLKEVSPKVIGYSFDSFKYHSAPVRWFKALNQFYTFDYRDSDQYNVPVIELFSSLPENDKPKKCTYEVSAIVRNHSLRLKYIDKVLSALSTDKVFIYVYEQNIVSFVQNFLRNPYLYWKYRKHISFKSLPYKEYARVLQESNFTIDFAHPSQTGITIRSFEALSTQTRIITNNSYVSKGKYFNDANTIVFNGACTSAELKDKFETLKKLVPEKHNRTINDFVHQIIA